MKKLLLLSLVICNCFVVMAQDLNNPGNYLDAINKAQEEMNVRYMAYVSASSHGKRARKVEKLRLQTLESINAAKFKTIDLPFFKGDNSLRQSSISYIDICYKVFNDDYARIVNMEDIAEQSFDEMQAYILLKEKVSERLKEANKAMNKAVEDFAAKNNVNLIEGESELGKKMEVANKVTAYYNKIYLVFFKCNWQDGKLTEALNQKKVNDAEQTRNSLLQFIAEGYKTLDTLKSFNGDASVLAACKQALNKYKQIAEKETPKKIDFLLKMENFEKIKAAFDKKGNNKTQQDVDEYNKAIKDYNASVAVSNQSGQTSNNLRNELIAEWEKTVQEFFDRQMPYFKK